MSVSIRCGVKVNGIRKESHSQCAEPVYNKKGERVKGCPLWNECVKELKDTKIEVYEDVATADEIASGKAFEDIDGTWKIFRRA